MNRWRILELVSPALAAFIINKKVLQDQQKLENAKENERQKVKSQITLKNETAFCKMADDLYANEMQRLNILARKATSILAATGFVIALTSLTLAAKKDWLSTYNFFSLTCLLLIVLAVVFFVASAVSASMALRVARFHQVDLTDVNQIINQKVDEQVFRNQWAIEKVLDIDLNYKTLTIQTNWLYAAQSSFLNGIFLIIASYAFLVIAL